MSYAKLTYADGSQEVVELIGHVRVEVDSEVPFSRTFNSAGLVGIEMTDSEPKVTKARPVVEAEALASPTVPDAVTETPAPAPAKPKRSAAKKPAAKKPGSGTHTGPGSRRSHTPAKDAQAKKGADKTSAAKK